MYKENLRAILGPTNTGKTYFAIERMLAHASGIMGFPLRLLARENYDKISRTLGKDKAETSTSITTPDASVASGSRLVKANYSGPTAASHDWSGPCS